MKPKRNIRERGEPELSLAFNAEPDEAAYAWYIEAKLSRHHAGVGSHALFMARCEEHARGIYDEMFPGRVIVRVRKNDKPISVRQALKRGVAIEAKWFKKEMPARPRWAPSLKRVIRDR